MSYRHETFENFNSKHIQITHEAMSTGGLIIPRALAYIHLVETVPAPTSIVIPSFTETVMLVGPEAFKGEANPEFSFEEEDLKIFSVRTMAALRKMLDTMEQVEVEGAVTIQATAEEQEEIEEIRHTIQTELLPKDPRPYPGFYM